MRRTSRRSAPTFFTPSPMLRSCVVLVALLAACARSTPPAGDTQAPAPQRDSRDVIATSDDIQRSPNESVEKYLMGRSAGVVVLRTSDGGIAVRVRGGMSVLGNNDPLYIVDGVPFATGPEGSLIGINPYDIASIRVLKDPADITMYGIRGANGVIIIKTKSGRP